MDLHEYHDLARKGLRIHAKTADPLTLHAAELLLQATKPKLTPPQQNAAIVLRKQVDAYLALYPDPLE